MRLTTVAFVLVVILSNIGYAQDLPEECKPYIMEAREIINERNAKIDEYKAGKVVSDSILAKNTKYRESAQRLLIKHEMLLQINDTTLVLFDERGELLHAQVSDYENLSDVLYKTCVENVIGKGPRKWCIYAALIGGFVVGLAL